VVAFDAVMLFFFESLFDGDDSDSDNDYDYDYDDGDANDSVFDSVVDDDDPTQVRRSLSRHFGCKSWGAAAQVAGLCIAVVRSGGTCDAWVA